MRKFIGFLLISGICLAASLGIAFAAPPPSIQPGSAAVSVKENETKVTTVVASDGDLPLIYSITGGPDAALFTIDSDTGELMFNAKPDFEIPRDNGSNNVYDITVTVTDRHSTPRADTQNIVVNVSNVKEALITTVPDSQKVVKETLAALKGPIIVEKGDAKLKEVKLSVSNGTLSVKLEGNTRSIPSEGNGNPLTLLGTQDDVNNTLKTLAYQGKRSFAGDDLLTVASTNLTPLTHKATMGIKVVATLVPTCDWDMSGNEKYAGDLTQNWSAGAIASYSLVQYNLADKKSSFNSKALGAGIAFRYYRDRHLKWFGENKLGKRNARIIPGTLWDSYEEGDYVENVGIADIPAGCRAQSEDLLGATNKIAPMYSISPTMYVFQEKNEDDFGVQFAVNVGFLNDIFNIGIGWNLSGDDAGEWFILAGPSFGFNF